MKSSCMKKILIIMMIFMLTFSSAGKILGTENENVENPSEFVVELGDVDTEDKSKDDTENLDKQVETDEKNHEMNDASEKIIKGSSERDKKKKQYIDKYNDEFHGSIAYIIDRIRYYSFPICFIGISIGAFNFLIIGNKKLDKKEQGFAWIVGFTIGLVVFNVLPLLYALIAIGR